MTSKTLGPRYDRHENAYKQPLVNWLPLERKTRGAIAVEVSKRPMRVPQFSIKVGAVKVDDEGQVIETMPFMSIYMIDDLIAVLQETRDKYISLRENCLKDENPNMISGASRYTNDEVDYEAEPPAAVQHRRR